MRGPRSPDLPARRGGARAAAARRDRAWGRPGGACAARTSSWARRTGPGRPRTLRSCCAATRCGTRSILRLLAVERLVRGLLLVPLAYGVYRFDGARNSLQQVFDSYLPLLRPLADRLGIDLETAGPVRLIEKALNAQHSTLRAGRGRGPRLRRPRARRGRRAVADEALGRVRRRRRDLGLHPAGGLRARSRPSPGVRVAALLLNVFAVVYLLWTKRLFGIARRQGGVRGRARTASRCSRSSAPPWSATPHADRAVVGTLDVPTGQLWALWTCRPGSCGHAADRAVVGTLSQPSGQLWALRNSSARQRECLEVPGQCSESAHNCPVSGLRVPTTARSASDGEAAVAQVRAQGVGVGEQHRVHAGLGGRGDVVGAVVDEDQRGERQADALRQQVEDRAGPAWPRPRSPRPRCPRTGRGSRSPPGRAGTARADQLVSANSGTPAACRSRSSVDRCPATSPTQRRARSGRR